MDVDTHVGIYIEQLDRGEGKQELLPGYCQGEEMDVESPVGLGESINITRTEEAMVVDEEKVVDPDYEICDDEENDEEHEYEKDLEDEDIDVCES